jgi:ubiquinone/menaquinone biosynthesis C-methylase UbiE
MFESFEKRSLEPERLDLGKYTAAEYALWQKEIRFVHRILGEMRALTRTLVKEAAASGDQNLSILDVGAGSGDLLIALGRRLGAKDAFLVAADLNIEALGSIKNTNAHITAVGCNSMRLPFADNSFDYSFSTLFLHHLADDDAIRFLKEIDRVTLRKFFVVDLHRHAASYYLYRLIGTIFLQRFTLEDGALSIRKSFRPDELRRLVQSAGIDNVRIKRSAAFRLILSGGNG